ncbi:MAG TPA: endonuclease/exonuclease/phosphatase family protein, partial [Bacteroidia bacterium]|nr:endonuclease/exonuclease/phosphatase family protein [Bacteroidia bacterium]
PAFVMLNFLFLMLWAIRRRRQAFYTLAILMLSIPYYGKQFRFHFGSREKAPANSINVMSYNVKLFDLYNWSGNKQTRSKMFTLIAKQKPDLLSLQEFFNRDSGDYRNLDSLKQLLHFPYAHYEYTISLHKDDHWGVVTFSKYPIVNQGKIVFNNRNNNICIYTDILIEKDTIRVYNMHLQSVSFGYADYKFLGKIYSGEDADSELASSENILRRMKRAYAKRARQSESIAAHIASCRYPVIVCGDFNDTPVSYSYRTISSGLEDAFIESGTGFGKSFVNPFPIPRIDYILHSPSLHAFEFSVIPDENLSDHYPVVCKITLN